MHSNKKIEFRLKSLILNNRDKAIS